jgi:ribosomal protein S18 acetylase RimI-like enzyme
VTCRYVPPCDLVPASAYTVQELTDAYNRSRVDYIVPMPMNVARLQAYIDDYDVDLTRSVVARDGDDILGLAMLGTRPGQAWITRLGVLPVRRRCGAGEAMMRYLIEQSRDAGVDHVMLEVIKDNVPAHRLFRKLGFDETRELLILRRPPGPPAVEAPRYTVTHDGPDRALALLERRRSQPSWLDDVASLRHSKELHCLEAGCEDGGRGWLVYERTVFQLGRLVVQAEEGDPALVAQVLAHALHAENAIQDTKTENFPAADPHLPGLQAMRYFESFRRIEMRLDLNEVPASLV